MKQFYLQIILIFSMISRWSQAPSIEWQRHLAEPAGPWKIIAVDGGYIVVGSTEFSDEGTAPGSGNPDGLIVKLNSSGIVEWQKNYGGSGIDEFRSIIKTEGDKYILCGHTNSTDYDLAGINFTELTRAWFMVVDSNGEVILQKVFGTEGDIMKDIKQTSDLGYILVGDDDLNSTGDFKINKLDAEGNLQWSKQYGGSGQDVAQAVIQNLDGTYLVTGWTSSNDGDVVAQHGDTDIWVLKLNAEGEMLWQKTIGGSGFEFCAYAIPTEGGYIIAGDTESQDGDVQSNVHPEDLDLWIVKMDHDGNIISESSYGGTTMEFCTGLLATEDGGYFAIGLSQLNNGDVTSFQGEQDNWLIKFDANGALQWQRSFGGSGEDQPKSVCPASDGGYTVVSHTTSNDGDLAGNTQNAACWIYKIDPGTLEPQVPDYANLQFPVTCSISVSSPTLTVYGQIYKSGLTDVAPNITGQAPTIQAWVGLSPMGENSDPATWSNWIPATHNAAHIGNNDEYMADISADVFTPGTYYYATRYLLANGNFVYGGITSSGTGGFWDGTTYQSGVLTVVTEPEVSLTGTYNVAVERLNGAIGTFYFYDEPVNFISPNFYRTTTVATFYPQGGTPGSAGTVALIVAGGQEGFTIKKEGLQIKVPPQTVFDSYPNQLSQSPSQYAASVYNSASGSFVVEYSISFASGVVDYRSTYNPVNLAASSSHFPNFQYYPNPTTGPTYVTGLTNFEYIVFDISGKKLFAGYKSGEETSVDFSGVASGLYFLKIVKEGSSKTVRVVKS